MSASIQLLTRAIQPLEILPRKDAPMCLAEIAEASGSSPVYSLLKREDEKFVTEDAFSRPTFVEDVVRNVASRLADHPHVSGFRVEVESYESIHAHNAFACIEHGVTL